MFRGAWALLLSRYSAETEVVFGSSLLDSGTSTNIVPVRVEVSDETPAGSWLEELHEQTQESLRHADCSIADLQKWSETPEGTALFESIFIHRESPGPVEPGGGADSGSITEQLRSMPVPCGLALVAYGAQHLQLVYDRNRFDAATARRMLGHFKVLLLGVTSRPDEPLAALELVTGAERRQLLVDWNETRRSYPDATVQELFQARVGEAPDRTAVVFEDQRLTYAELDRRANQLARHLQGLGVGPDALVGIYIERSLEMVIGLLGVLKAGGAYLPLDPEYPAERVAFMVSDAEITALLTAGKLVARLPAVEAPVLCLDTGWDRIARESPSAPESQATADDLAYVIYTSGSTGRPKGAMNGQRAICNRLLWMQEEYGLTPADTVLQKTPFSFDVSVWEFFWPLITGARLVLARPGGHKQSDYLVDLITDQEITVLHFVPSMLRLFLEQPNLRASRTLRHVFCSGEALSFELQERFFESLDANLHNLYGPTEAAIDVTFWACERNSETRLVPIGRPVANTQIHLLDAQLQLVPIGVPGELHIGGVQLARGYLNRPELTAERFIENPFSQEPGSRLYKTGDLARRLPDGSIEYLGRLDHQTKVRGFRIELGEIESILRDHPDVHDTVVIARESASHFQQLVAYIVPEQSTPRLVSGIRGFLEQKLPEYMVPSAFVLLDALPLTPNGKLDRRALPAPTRERPPLEQAYVAPRTGLERYLAKLWCELLELDRVGTADRFFELGGDSLLAAHFINVLRRELDESIYVVSVFEAPTIAEYAVFLTEDYPEAVSRLFADERATADIGRIRDRSDHPEARIDEASIAKMRQVIPSLPRRGDAVTDESRNPPALFMLAPPRSGTTLLRVILAGHPGLLPCSELQLLCFHTLEERRTAFTGKFSLWLDGTIRALMEIQRCDAETAKRLMEGYEQRKFTTKAFYRLMQQWIGGRMLVDKSPFYALDLETLRKAERDFRDPLYIHLVRHPYAMVRSFEDYHMDQVLLLDDHSFSRRQLGELVWTVSHQNILEFLKTVPPQRQFRMRFEDLVSRPAAVLEGMCEALGFEFHPGLLQPYEDQDRKMIDGVHSVSTPMGDRKFLEHERINPEVGEAWKQVETDDFLGEVTWQVAEALGYVKPSTPLHASRGPNRSAPRGTAPARRELRSERRRRRLEHRERDPAS